MPVVHDAGARRTRQSTVSSLPMRHDEWTSVPTGPHPVSPATLRLASSQPSPSGSGWLLAVHK